MEEDNKLVKSNKLRMITTIAYREYYSVTYAGRVIASVMMFAAIAFLWTLVVVNETKTMIKKKIDDIENLGEEDLEALVTIIRSLSGNKKK
jgi:voltage-gated potassium channel